MGANTNDLMRAPGYEALSCAIVEKAVSDYFKSKFFIDTLEIRCFKRHKNANWKQTLAEKRRPHDRMIHDCESFFKDSWFETLTDGILDASKAWDGLQETYKNKYYPEKYADWWPKEWAKHCRQFVKGLEKYKEVR